MICNNANALLYLSLMVERFSDAICVIIFVYFVFFLYKYNIVCSDLLFLLLDKEDNAHDDRQDGKITLEKLLFVVMKYESYTENNEISIQIYSAVCGSQTRKILLL